MDNMPKNSKRRKLAANVPRRDKAQKTIIGLKNLVSDMESSLIVANTKANSITRQVKELKGSLRIAKRKSDDIRFLHRKHREAADVLEVVEKEFLKGLESNERCARDQCFPVGPKAMGILDMRGDWCQVIYEMEPLEFIGFNSSMKWKSTADFKKFWEARIREPDFHGSALKDDGNGYVKYTINEHHEELNEMRMAYGDIVYEAVCKAHLEVMEWGTGSVLWHYIEKRKATVSDVLEHNYIRLSPTKDCDCSALAGPNV